MVPGGLMFMTGLRAVCFSLRYGCFYTGYLVWECLTVILRYSLGFLVVLVNYFSIVSFVRACG